MATDQFDDLLKRMQKIADSVNAFKSEEVQLAAFRALLDAAGVELNEEESEHGVPDEKTSKAAKKKPTKGAKRAENKALDAQDPEDFFAQFDHTRSAENVKLIVAWLYSQHGVFPITRAHIKETADNAGLTVAERSDNTMRQAKANGKALFTQGSKGWKLTLAGERYMKEAYGVKKGNKPLPEKNAE